MLVLAALAKYVSNNASLKADCQKFEPKSLLFLLFIYSFQLSCMHLIVKSLLRIQLFNSYFSYFQRFIISIIPFPLLVEKE